MQKIPSIRTKDRERKSAVKGLSLIHISSGGLTRKYRRGGVPVYRGRCYCLSCRPALFSDDGAADGGVLALCDGLHGRGEPRLSNTVPPAVSRCLPGVGEEKLAKGFAGEGG